MLKNISAKKFKNCVKNSVQNNRPAKLFNCIRVKYGDLLADLDYKNKHRPEMYQMKRFKNCKISFIAHL